MADRVVIAGAGGFGRGVLAWLAGSPLHRTRHDIDDVVFIDDGTPAVAPDAPVVGTIADYAPRPQDVVICAIGVPEVRRRVVESLAARGATFHTFVDDRAVVAPDVDLGVGAVVCPGVVVSANARIGAHVHVNFNCSVGHDATIGALSTLSPSVDVMGEVRIGEAVFLGGSAVVLPRLTIGPTATIGAGAVVVRDVPAGRTVVGNPAHEIAPRPGPGLPRPTAQDVSA